MCYQDPGFHLSTLIKSVLVYLSRGLASWPQVARTFSGFPGQTRPSLRSESNHHLWCVLQELGYIFPDHCLIPTISHCPGGPHANLDQTGKENPSYWLSLITVSSQTGWGSHFPESQGGYLYQIPVHEQRKEDWMSSTQSVFLREKQPFSWRWWWWGVGKSRAFHVKTSKLTVRSDLSRIRPLPSPTLACIPVPSYPFPSLDSSCLLPSFLPSFHFSSTEQKPTNVYSSFNIILSSGITVLNQTHTAPVCVFYNRRALSPFSSSPCTLFLYEAFYEHFSPQWSLSSIQSFYHPRGCLPIHAEPSVRKCKDVSWEILDIKSILELDSVCLLPSPPT